MNKILRAIDVCAGAGGWAVAARGLPIRIEYVFDLEFDCLLTYKANHPHVDAVRCNVIDFDFSRLAGKVDLILGGIPCEDISIARCMTPLSKEKEERLHDLIDKCLELPEQLGAEWWCYEDVTPIIKHLPPLTDYFVLNSAEFSSQRRKRAYVGNVPQPRGKKNAGILRDCLLPGPFRKSLTIRDREPRVGHVYGSKFFYPWYPGKKSPTVLGSMPRHDNYAAVWEDSIQDWRHLTWQEAALLQGFPTNYLFLGNLTRTSKMIAQAVQIDTARAILKALCRKEGLLDHDNSAIQTAAS